MMLFVMFIVAALLQLLIGMRGDISADSSRDALVMGGGNHSARPVEHALPRSGRQGGKQDSSFLINHHASSMQHQSERSSSKIENINLRRSIVVRSKHGMHGNICRSNVMRVTFMHLVVLRQQLASKAHAPSRTVPTPPIRGVPTLIHSLETQRMPNLIFASKKILPRQLASQADFIARRPSSSDGSMRGSATAGIRRPLLWTGCAA